VAADELQVKLTAKDDLTAKVKAARAEFTRLGKEVAAANRQLQATGKGRGEYDRLRAQWIAAGQEQARLRTQLTRTNREITRAGQGSVSGWQRAGTALSRYHATLQKVGAASALVGSLMGKKAVESTKTLISQAMATKRFMGGTVEEASRWNNAAALSGVKADAFATSMKFLGKSLETASGSEKRAAKMVEKLGFDFRDAHGNVRPLGELLPLISERFRQMPDGAEKTALAIQLFGRSGAGMIPMLNRGSAALDRFRAKASELGVVVGPEMEAQFKAYTAAQREYQQALLGFQVAIGTLLLPVVAAVMEKLQGVAQWMTHLPGPVRAVVVALGALTAAFLLAAPTVSRFMLAISNAGGWAAATAGIRGFMAPIVARGNLAAAGRFAVALAGVGLAVAGLSKLGPNKGPATGVDLLLAQLEAGGEEIGRFGHAAADGFGELGEALDYIASPSAMERFANVGDWAGDALAGIFGGEGFTSRREKALQEIGAIDQALVQMATEKGFPAAYAAFRRLTAAQKLNAQQTSDFKGMLPGFGEAWKKYTLASDAAADSTGGVGAAMDAAQVQARTLASQTRAVKEAVDALNAALDARRARLNLRSALLDWDRWVKEQKGGARAVLGATETAVEGQGKIIDLIAAVNAAADTYTDPIAKTAVLRAGYEQLARALAGLPSAARAAQLKPLTEELAKWNYQALQTKVPVVGVAGAGDALLTVEGLEHHFGVLDRTAAEPVVSAKTQTAQQRIAGVAAKLAAVDRQVAEPRVAVADSASAALDVIRGKLAALVGRVWTGVIQWRTSVGWAGGGPVPALATGGTWTGPGRVTGPGTGTSDSVAARLSAGEYVTRAAAVARVGLPVMAAVNRADGWSGERVRALVAAATGRPGDLAVPGWAPPAAAATAPAAQTAPGGPVEMHVHVHAAGPGELDVAAAARRAARAVLAEADADRRRRGTR